MTGQSVGKFKQKLLQSASRKVTFLLLLSALIFTVGQYGVILVSNETSVRQHLRELQESYAKLDRMETEFLMDRDTMEEACGVLDGTRSDTRLQQMLRRLNAQNGISSRYILIDNGGEILSASFQKEALTSYLVNYNAAICYNARHCTEDELYRSIYFDNSTYSDRMFVKPVYRDGDRLGFLTLFLSGADWNYALSDENFDGVITDTRGNVMYSSKRMFASGNNQFSAVENGAVEFNGLRYWVRGEKTADGGAKVYAMVYYPRNAALGAGLAALLIAALAWFVTARQVFLAMAERNAASIEHLVREIRYIRKTDSNHRIVIDSDDEFSEVAHQTNYMLDTLKGLNDRNTELLQLNNRIEIEQLTAQINPHFLYNTLEIIRNLALFDGVKAEQVITRLTQLLRYSIDYSRGEVSLGEDISYIQNYIDIQKIRFGDRFRCEMDITPECMECTVPKLLLQPLLENSIKYGFRNVMELTIRVEGRLDGSTLQLRVIDDGGGMEEEKARELQEQLANHDQDAASIGLRNLSRRLYLKYGESSGIEVVNNVGRGFEVIVRIENRRDPACIKS